MCCANLEASGCEAVWIPERIRYDASADVWSAALVANDILTGGFVFGWPPSEYELLRAIFALLGEPTELIWPGVSRLPLFQKFCEGRAIRTSHAALCSTALVWLQPDSLSEPTPGSHEADISACLRGCITYRPDSRLTAAAAGALFRRARATAAEAEEALAALPAALPAAPPAASPAAPSASSLPASVPWALQPDSQRRSSAAHEASQPPLQTLPQTPLDPPLQTLQHRPRKLPSPWGPSQFSGSLPACGDRRGCWNVPQADPPPQQGH